MKSESKEQSFYIAIILYELTSNAPNHKPLYDETFMLIQASSLEEAQQKAFLYGNEKQTSYLNENKETITCSLKHIVDVNSVLYNDFEDGTELYARHFRNYDAYRLFEPLLSNEESAL